MAVERSPSGSSLIDVLDRVLDKGIVIDAWVRVSLVGIDLVTVEARIVVASIDTYLKYSEAVGITAPVSRPRELVADTDSELDRVLDKGIVIDAWVRVSLVGIDLVTVEARVVVASIDTYLKYSEAVGITAPVSRPRELVADTESELERVMRENAELRRRLEQGGA